MNGHSQQAEKPMPSRILKHKPLIEAILEVKWALVEKGNDQKVDPDYKFALGRLFDRIGKEYPFHEELDAVRLPEELAGHIIQHRFRSAPDTWPLIQIGPGIFAVNECEGYTWDGFAARTESAIDALFNSYPADRSPKIQSLCLRYIDAVEFDWTVNDAFRFLDEKMRVQVQLPEQLFSGDRVLPLPGGFRWQTSYQCLKPKGTLALRFMTGEVKEKKKALIWETILTSEGSSVPSLPDGFTAWADEAHTTCDAWFFTLIEGELERMFDGK